MKNFHRQGYKGVTETWNVLQHEVKKRHQRSFLVNLKFDKVSQSVELSSGGKHFKSFQRKFNINSYV